MSTSNFTPRSSLPRTSVLFAAAAAAVAALVVLPSGCETGGKAGDRCNPLVLRDECDPGLHCKAATCSESYCCPTDGKSSDPHCNAEGCPDTDGGDEAGDDSGGAQDAGIDTGSPSDSSVGEGGDAAAGDAADAAG